MGVVGPDAMYPGQRTWRGENPFGVATMQGLARIPRSRSHTVEPSGPDRKQGTPKGIARPRQTSNPIHPIPIRHAESKLRGLQDCRALTIAD